MPEKTFVDAIQEKYDDDNESQNVVIYLPKGAPGKTVSGDIAVPSCLTLDKRAISLAGDQQRIAHLCANVSELDLAGNLLIDWLEVFKIVDQLPRVSFLNLSSNQFGGALPNAHGKQFTSVSKLVLNDTHLSWSAIAELLSIFSSIQELHLSFNTYEKVSLPQSATSDTLERLHFNSNDVQTWEDIARLGRAFPAIQQLAMSGNPLRQTDPPSSGTFCKLQSINISDTAIATWSQLEKLRAFPSLTAIRVKRIPLLKDHDEDTGRQLVISYLPNIQYLNGSVVLEGERVDAERAFIRYYMDSDVKPHRYGELEVIHGKLDHLASVDLTPKTSALVTIHFGETQVSKTVDLYWTLTDLKKYIVGIVGRPAKTFRVFLEDREDMYRSEEMRFLKRKMFSYGLKDGDDLYVELKYDTLPSGASPEQ